jgi:hypothetical protein
VIEANGSTKAYLSKSAGTESDETMIPYRMTWRNSRDTKEETFSQNDNSSWSEDVCIRNDVEKISPQNDFEGI